MVLSCVLAAACFAPENFDATLAIDKRRHFQFTYDGTIAFGPALGQIKQAGRLSAAEELQMQAQTADIRKMKGIVSAMYVGNGRYKIEYREAGLLQSGRTLFLDLIKFQSDANGGVRVIGQSMPADVQKQMSETGLALDGRIRLTSEIPVVEHNAESTPWFGGLFGAYKWHVTSRQLLIPTVVIR